MTSVSQKIVQNYGIEVNEGVQWQGWEPGGEYTKQITLKNVQVKTQKIIYKVPNSRFFTTLYPKPVILTCGTSFSLPVTFRPLEKDQYEDKIEFQTKDGKFAVSIKAVLPKADLIVPENLTFGMCAIKDTVETSFNMTNPSDVHTSFKWSVEEPFALSPSSGSLAPQTSCLIKATFSPKGGFVYNAIAVCQFGNPSDLMEKHIHLEGIGKYPHIMVKLPGANNQTRRTDILGETLLEFGDVPVGNTVEKSIHFHNSSPVNASFQVIQPSSVSNLDKVFTCSQYHGVIAPESTARIKVLYTPSCPRATYVDYFEVNVLGAANCSVIKCLGKGKGPRVAIDCSSAAFGRVVSGGCITKIINVTNNSDVSTAFQFLIDKTNSVFAFEKTTGYLTANATQSIVVRFRPVQPINYYRKVTCLVRNHEPLSLELFGTCHTELVKPAVLQQKHVDQYKSYVQRGLSRISPGELNGMLNEGKIDVDENGILANPENTLEEVCEESLTPEEAFFDDPSVGETAFITPHISLDHYQLNFGKCSKIITVEQKTVNITNHTKGKVTCNWMTESEGVFTVSPESADILPLKTASFTVTFRPNQENQFFGTEIECFVSYKCARDYRLVEDKTLLPPWCVAIYCSGETFGRDRESFLPRLEFDTTQLVFPAVTLHNNSYRTLLMVNPSSTPVRFSLDQDPTRSFRCKPSQGIIKDGLQAVAFGAMCRMQAALDLLEQLAMLMKFTKLVKAGRDFYKRRNIGEKLVMFRYEATENKVHKLPLTCHLNNEEKYSQDILLIGSSESPKLHLDDKGVLYFRPTCLGNVTKRAFKVQNRSRIPLSFEWKTREADSSVIQIEPRFGTILPGERQIHTWSFCPVREKKYLIKCKLFLKAGEGVAEPKNVSPTQPYLSRAVGTGVTGKLTCPDSLIDFDKIAVGTSVTKKIILFNPNDCDLAYRLVLINDNEDEHEKPVIELSKSCDSTIPAKTNTFIQVKASPRKRTTYKTKINYQLISLQEDSGNNYTVESSPLCCVSVLGVYPTLVVEDIRATGSGESYSKVQLWKLFSLESFNSCLDSDPLPTEGTDSVATRYSDRRRPHVSTRAVINFSFGSAGCESEPTVIYLSLRNSGSVAADWAFLFPNDLQLELEYWAETGEYSSEELHEMQTMGHHLFSVEPSSGSLVAGDAQTVVLKYRHTIVGINRLPVLFKITRGREVLLNFTGVTVDKKQPFVHFSSTNYMFTPVPVGLATPPVQSYAFYNGGSVNATYDIDLSPLQALHKENYRCEIFNCLNPTGTIAPGKTALIHWVFAPLEAKTYIMDIPIRILGCETTLVTFTGIGYDHRAVGKTMSFSDSVVDIPTRQIAFVESQLASLSQERVRLGCVPLFSKHRRVIFLKNNSIDHTISFRWLLANSFTENIVEIHPQFGILNPQASVALKITFFSSGTPALHDIDLLCEVTDDTLMGDYNHKLQEWYNAKEEEKYTFTITEKDVLEEKQKKLKKKTISESTKRLSKSEGDLKKFTALPPIGFAKSCSRSARSKDKNEKCSSCPVPPKPFSVHLSVTAQTLEPGDVHIARNVLTLTSALMRKHTLRRHPLDREQPSLTTSSPQELRVVTEVLSVILRGLLDDENFHTDVKGLQDDSIPYFRQFQGVSSEEPREDSVTPEVRHELPHTDFKEIPIVRISPNTPTAESMSSRNEVPDQSLTDVIKEDPSHLHNNIRSSAEFASLAEEVFENTLLNLVWEANLGEVNLTTRPRIIALPPNRSKKKP